MEPVIRCLSDGSPNLVYTLEGRRIQNQHKGNERKNWRPPQTSEHVRQDATKRVKELGGNPANEIHLLGQYQLQFGAFRGQTFKWLLENVMGYVAYLVVSMEKEKPKDSSQDLNKLALKKYVSLLPKAMEAVHRKRSEMPQASRFSSAKQLHRDQPPQVLQPGMKKGTSPQTSQPNIPSSSPPRPATMSDEDLLVQVFAVEKSSLGATDTPSEKSPTTSEQPVASTSAAITSTEESVAVVPLLPEPRTSALSAVTESADSRTLQNLTTEPESTTDAAPQSTSRQPTDTTSSAELYTYPLYSGWRKTLPVHDHQWISKALFHVDKTAELDITKVDKLWWYPPQPSLTSNTKPRLDRYFSKPLFLWMPVKLWRIQLRCPQPECDTILSSSGVYTKVRQVLDVDGYYSMASEYLRCSGCTKKVIAWSYDILTQLDIAHRIQFPCILTSRKACDLKVIRLMRNRGLGNSSSQILRKLEEQHYEAWLQRTIQYLSDCQLFSKAAATRLLLPMAFDNPPSLTPVTSYHWLMQVYALDVMQRLDEVKASITSLFGRVLKMDSTKKVVKKLAGESAKTAMWATNCGNEYGQIIMSVLTAAEGGGLTSMIQGIIKRYSDAGMPPPELLYVDRDCCGTSHLRRMFSSWRDLEIKLDVWHFMRRIAVGCTTESHQLYGTFMSRLSQCIFQWDTSDLEALKTAKRAEMASEGIQEPSDADVMRRITRNELSLHCRRTTRGVDATTNLITQLISRFDGASGRDSLGVPLINSKKMALIWEQQKKHVPCFQDPHNISLYYQTGTIRKGGMSLPTYRCTRGSTSLESFHLHLNRFIPGTLASATYFQAYLLDGLARWNEDRAAVATSASMSQTPLKVQTYSGLLRHTANQLGRNILGSDICPGYTPPRAYTGELIGVEYLYHQTGRVLQDYSTAEQQVQEQIEEDTQPEEDEGFAEADEVEDMTVPPASPPSQSPLPVTVEPPVSSPSVQSEPRVPSPPPVQTEPSAPSPPIPPPVMTESRTVLPIPTETDYRAILSTISGPISDRHLPLIKNVRRQLDLQAREDHTDHTPVTQETRMPDVSASTTETTINPDESVGPDNIPGYGKVQDLAEYLVGLQDSSGALTNEQAAHLVELWKALYDYDKQRTIFPPRHTYRQSPGRYRSPKKVVAPGVESTRRCFLGPNTGPAQWPDCNRYVEATIQKLCHMYPSGQHTSGGTLVNRWSRILKAYENIRQCVLNNSVVMDETTLQLPAINKTTLTQWHNRRGKEQERKVLTQGLEMPPLSLTASFRLPQPLPKPTTLPRGTVDRPHRFITPPNTAGTVKPTRRGRRQSRRAPVSATVRMEPTPSPTETVPSPGLPLVIPITAPLFPNPQHIFTEHHTGTVNILPATLPETSSISQPAMSEKVKYTTARYRKRKLEDAAKGITTRTYVKKSTGRMCKKCKMPIQESTHKLYWGNVYCEATDSMSYAEWVAPLKGKYGKRTPPSTTPPPPDDGQ